MFLGKRRFLLVVKLSVCFVAVLQPGKFYGCAGLLVDYPIALQPLAFEPVERGVKRFSKLGVGEDFFYPVENKRFLSPVELFQVAYETVGIRGSEFGHLRFSPYSPISFLSSARLILRFFPDSTCSTAFQKSGSAKRRISSA